MRPGEGPVVIFYIILIVGLLGWFVVDSRKALQERDSIITQQDQILEQQKVVIERMSTYILLGGNAELYYQTQPDNNEHRPIH